MKMTQIYIEEMYQAGGADSPKKCGWCAAPAIKSMCPKHLKRMRENWMTWQIERVAKCLCVKCNRKSHKIEEILQTRQGVYCRVHREENRVKCLAWARKNRSAIRAQYKARVQAGVCANSPSHGKASKGNNLCSVCLLRNRQANARQTLLKRIERMAAR